MAESFSAERFIGGLVTGAFIAFLTLLWYDPLAIPSFLLRHHDHRFDYALQTADKKAAGNEPCKVIYFATGAEGHLYEQPPLNKPVMEDPEIITWAGLSLLSGLNDRQTPKNAADFSAVSWQKMQQVFQAFPGLQVELASAPALLQKGVFGGHYRHVFSIKMKLTAVSNSEALGQILEFKLVVERVEQSVNAKGIQVVDMEARRGQP